MRGLRRTVRLLAVGAVLTCVIAGLAGAVAPAAQAQDRSATSAEVAALARDAVTSDRALAELRAIRRVDGHPVDLKAATEGIETTDARRVRLIALAQVFERGSGGSADSAAARRDAHAVVRGREYRNVSPPKPFKGMLRWIGDRLEPVGRVLAPVFRPVAKLWDWILGLFDHLPGGRYILLALVAGLVAWGAVILARRRSRAALERGPDGRLLVDPAADPAELERRAAEAEAAGDLAAAVRLRYEAGLIRLVRAGRLTLRPETTPGSAAGEVGGPEIAALTRDFEEIVYGERAATAADVDRSRSGWVALLGAKAAR